VVAVYEQVLDPVAQSLARSSLVAALPLLLLFVMLGALRVTAWVASLVSLVLAIVLAVLVYGMPLGQSLLAGTEGAAFGFFPILWIVINAIWVYQMTVETGHFDVLRRSFARVSDDQRVQAVIIAFSFGALLEALAGFGTPVAIVDGWRGLRETWPVALVCGVVFAIGQYATSNFISVPLADVVASLLSAVAVVGMVRSWHPRREQAPAVIAGGAADQPTEDFAKRLNTSQPNPDDRAEVARTYAPTRSSSRSS
jgi:L-lactate permease